LRAKKVEKLRNSSNKTNKYFIVNQDAPKDRGGGEEGQKS